MVWLLALLLLASWASLVASQALCLSVALLIPQCAQSCLQSAGRKAGCGITDFSCQCGTNSASISSAAATCVDQGCGVSQGNVVRSSVAKLCSCALPASVPAVALTVLTDANGSPTATATIGLASLANPAAASRSSTAAAASTASRTAALGGATAAPTAQAASGPDLKVLLPAIIVPVVVVIAALVGVIVWLVYRSRDKRRAEPSATAPAPSTQPPQLQEFKYPDAQYVMPATQQQSHQQTVHELESPPAPAPPIYSRY